MTSRPNRGGTIPVPTTTRGQQRSEQIVRAAAFLFQETGYQNVSIDQIGAAVGLTGPAVYRHFKGKYGILVRALRDQVDLVEQLTLHADTTGETPAQQLELFLDGLADITANGDESTLWRREQRHLEVAEQHEMVDYFRGFRDYIAGKIVAADPTVTPDRAELLGFAVLTVFSNTSTIRGNLQPDRLIQLQKAVFHAIISCPLPEPAPDAQPERKPVPWRPAGRRERIIEVSTQLFDERGFYDVRIDDIARAAEMSVATLYQHVSGKAQVLRAILERGAEGLLYVSADALAMAGNAHEALDALIRVYVRQALGIHGRIMHILTRDLLYLSEDEQVSLRETQREYVAEWVDAIRTLSGNLSGPEARALAHAVIGVLTDVTQAPDLRARPGIGDELVALAHAIALPTELIDS
ncbi:TetR/AcrR family transcriptional regulator [Gordonia amicalis]|uniref:TetR/AcrR family transcriptional regulator n=1 Tax=Gordonia amicalis TaxID=89053 RepID=UPI0002A65A35|nr:TetR/AcrR family transcriptional regulator [Gordonia amicalis]MDV7173825.1 TetR/AcrR family transcriptional regulator [Gordonia amicalis]UKO90855.1 TetR/AcrR family transcriptional regulator [Gordonia amicalis]UOG22366.1 TetR/AcrR family transcriptional regulator [Gordonia amicalis]GAC54111.1 putative TetR family transcriptional regulator [Gordonia amicalis NBRC 100051 = JCM 11271]